MAVTGSDTPTHRRRKTPDVALERAEGEVRNFHPSPEIFIFRRRRAAEEMVGPFIISRIRNGRKRDGEGIDLGGGGENTYGNEGATWEFYFMLRLVQEKPKRTYSSSQSKGNSRGSLSVKICTPYILFPTYPM